jgi:hypothetical protein
VGSSECGGCGIFIARVLPPTFSANCKAGIATLSAIHFASMVLARFQDYAYHQSQTSVWWGDLWNQLPKGGHGTSSHTSVGYTNFQYASCIIYLRHFWYYSDTTIYITGWGQVEIQGYIHLGMQMPTICTTYLDFAQDTSRILGW